MELFDVDEEAFQDAVKNFRDIVKGSAGSCYIFSGSKKNDKTPNMSNCFVLFNYGERLDFEPSPGNPSKITPKFKPCAQLHATPMIQSVEKPLLHLATPEDIPLVLKHAYSNDGHLRYHAIEQLYLLYQRWELKEILEDNLLVDVCIDTLARQHADTRTRSYCMLMLFKALESLQQFAGKFMESFMHDPKGPLAFWKLYGVAHKLFKKHRLQDISETKNFVTAYSIWSNAPKKATSKIQQVDILKNLARGIRTCKLGAAAACDVTGVKPTEVFGAMAGKQSADNLDAHLVRCFCVAMQGQREEACHKLRSALTQFPDDPWLLILLGQCLEVPPFTWKSKTMPDGSIHKIQEVTDIQEVMAVMKKAWLGLRKTGVYTMECFELLLYHAVEDMRYTLAYDVALDAIENIPIDDKRYSMVAYLMAILHLEDLYHPHNPLQPSTEPHMDPVKGFVKYYKLAQEAEKIKQEIWGSIGSCRYQRVATEIALFLKKFFLLPGEMRTLSNSISYYRPKEKKHGFTEMYQCACCGMPANATALLKCSRCRVVRYCSNECQKYDWSAHRDLCRRF